MSFVSLQRLSKTFDSIEAVRDVTLEIKSGEFVSILGPSGCGKTTLLRMIAGFERPTSGDIFIEGRNITSLPPQQRNIGMVFQNYALFPHMSVFQNVAFGLETRKVPSPEIKSRVEAVLESVHLAHKINTLVPNLSGGEQQRVAVARALVVRPAVLLFDEPLSNLDVALRQSTREEIRALQRSAGVTAIYVTHDQAEAMSLSDRIAVMRGGRCVQVGAPAEIYEHPSTSFVAEFVGAANVLHGDVNVDELKIRVGSFLLAVPRTVLTGKRNGKVSVVVKPEAIQLSLKVLEGEYEGKVTHKEYHGFTTQFVVECQGIQLRAATVSSVVSKQLQTGDIVGVSIDWSRCTLLNEDV